MTPSPRLSDQKYPADIIETVAKAIATSDVFGHRLAERWDDEDWEDGREHWRGMARAALDALGLTVTEEWGALGDYNGHHTARKREHGEALARRWQKPLMHRTVLHAQTPWVEVTPDA